MSDRGYKIRNKAGIHFLTFAVVEWVDVFTRKLYKDILVDSLRYCQEKKGLILHSWNIMSNHVQLIASAENNDLSDILRDFKKFTSKQVIAAIKDNEKESRREWMLEIFRQQAAKNCHNTNYQLWRQDNQPKECFSPAFTVQKLNYIHNNPVVAGIVHKPEDYIYSSARSYCGKEGLLKVAHL